MTAPRKILAALLLILGASICASPIRVLFLKISGTGSSHAASTAIGSPFLEDMLANLNGPMGVASLTNDSAGTGAPPRIPSAGFQVDTIGQGSKFTAEQRTRFLVMLDSIDVLVMVNTSLVGEILTSASDRLKFLAFAQRKGIVALHFAAYNRVDGTAWAAYDSLVGTSVSNAYDVSPTMQNTTMTAFQDTLTPHDSVFTLLASGLRPRYTYYGEILRHGNPRSAKANVLFALDESSYTPSWTMHDHPFVWYRESFSGLGGRFWLTMLGHEDTLYSQSYFFRRQIYNAVLWASQYNGSAVGVVPDIQAPIRPSFETFVDGVMLHVLPAVAGPVSTEIRMLDGKAVATARGAGPKTFAVRRGTMYAVSVSSANGRQTRLIAVP